MLYTVPDYYREFRCAAGQCEDTCCAGWQIVIDERALQRYKKEKSGYRKVLKKAIRWDKKIFRQDEEKRCAFLTEDNLCDMYRNLGAQSLCRTCRLYPRHIEEFEDVREISLSVSCPEVARLLLKKKEPVIFHSFERSGEEEFPEFDPFFYSKLTDARNLMFEILQNRRLPIENRIVLCIGLAWDMEKRVEAENLFSCDEMFGEYKRQVHFSEAGRKADRYLCDGRRQYMLSRKLFEDLHRLELLREDWERLLIETEAVLFGRGCDSYDMLIKEFRSWMDEHSGKEDVTVNWPIQCEQLMVYFIFTYFCGAVYDGRIFVNVQMAAASVIIIWNLLAARWLENEKSLDVEDMIDMVYRYSRELEHSDQNLKDFGKMLEKQRALMR